jgi:hypothetical protein
VAKPQASELPAALAAHQLLLLLLLLLLLQLDIQQLDLAGAAAVADALGSAGQIQLKFDH